MLVSLRYQCVGKTSPLIVLVALDSKYLAGAPPIQGSSVTYRHNLFSTTITQSSLSSDSIPVPRQVDENVAPMVCKTRSSSSPGCENSDSEPLVVEAPIAAKELFARLKDAEPVLNEGDSILRERLKAREKHFQALIKEAVLYNHMPVLTIIMHDSMNHIGEICSTQREKDTSIGQDSIWKAYELLNKLIEIVI